MNSEPILICYDGSESAQHSLEAAARVLTRRKRSSWTSGRC
jgi:hypothetical protein